MFPTTSFRVCVRPTSRNTHMSAEDSAFCADVDRADFKNYGNRLPVLEKKALYLLLVRSEEELSSRSAMASA
jgi:hypothetical protein